MAEFKKLSDVETVETVSDNANVLIEENGEIKKIPAGEISKDDNKGGGMYVVNAYKDSRTYDGDTDKMLECLNNGIPVFIIAHNEERTNAEMCVIEGIEEVYGKQNVYFHSKNIFPGDGEWSLKHGGQIQYIG